MINSNGLNAETYGIKPKEFQYNTLDADFSVVPDGVNLIFKINSHNMSSKLSADTARKLRDYIDEWLEKE